MEKKEKVRQVRAAETRRKIVAAAKKLIAENGFESVAIEDIAIGKGLKDSIIGLATPMLIVHVMSSARLTWICNR